MSETPAPLPAPPPLPPGAASWRAGDWFVRVIVPVYVVIGAGMKLFTALPEQLPGFNLVDDPSDATLRLAAWVLPVVVAMELALAGLMFFHRGLARRVAVVTLAVFVGVLIPLIFRNAASCGCFGAIRTDPWMMLTTAGVGLGLIALLPFARIERSLRNGAWIGVLILAVVGTSVAFGVSAMHIPERLGWRTTMVRLRPSEWVGTPVRALPFAPFVQSLAGVPIEPATVKDGTIVIWMRTCQYCHAMFREKYAGPTTERVLAIELPPDEHGVPPEPVEIACTSCERAVLSPGRMYILSHTPVVLTVRSGVVTHVNVRGTDYQ